MQLESHAVALSVRGKGTDVHLGLESCDSTDAAHGPDRGRPRQATQTLGEAPASVLVSQQFTKRNIYVSVFSGMFVRIISFTTIQLKIQ